MMGRFDGDSPLPVNKPLSLSNWFLHCIIPLAGIDEKVRWLPLTFVSSASEKVREEKCRPWINGCARVYCRNIDQGKNRWWFSPACKQTSLSLSNWFLLASSPLPVSMRKFDSCRWLSVRPQSKKIREEKCRRWNNGCVRVYCRNIDQGKNRWWFSPACKQTSLSIELIFACINTVASIDEKVRGLPLTFVSSSFEKVREEKCRLCINGRARVYGRNIDQGEKRWWFSPACKQTSLSIKLSFACIITVDSIDEKVRWLMTERTRYPSIDVNGYPWNESRKRWNWPSVNFVPCSIEKVREEKCRPWFTGCARVYCRNIDQGKNRWWFSPACKQTSLSIELIFACIITVASIDEKVRWLPVTSFLYSIEKVREEKCRPWINGCARVYCRNIDQGKNRWWFSPACKQTSLSIELIFACIITVASIDEKVRWLPVTSFLYSIEKVREEKCRPWINGCARVYCRNIDQGKNRWWISPAGKQTSLLSLFSLSLSLALALALSVSLSGSLFFRFSFCSFLSLALSRSSRVVYYLNLIDSAVDHHYNKHTSADRSKFSNKKIMAINCNSAEISSVVFMAMAILLCCTINATGALEMRVALWSLTASSARVKSSRMNISTAFHSTTIPSVEGSTSLSSVRNVSLSYIIVEHEKCFEFCNK